jgi:hypothetical protein
MADLPHFIFRGIGQVSENFRPFGGGGDKHPSPVPDRIAHAAKLRGDLASISARIDDCKFVQASAGVPKSRYGATIRATGRLNEPLVVGDRKPSSPGFSLLSVDRERRRQRAVYFVQSGSLKTLLDQLDEYEVWTAHLNSTRVRRHPTNFQLFESAEKFEIAEAEHLWSGPSNAFPSGDIASSVEVWIRSNWKAYFFNALASLHLSVAGARTDFVDSVVLDLELTGAQMDELVRASGAVIEFRPASNFLSRLSGLDPYQKQGVADRIASRIVPAPGNAPRTVLLDSGVNSKHILLHDSLPPGTRKSAHPKWSVSDHSGHGTHMAGVALFGDLERLVGKSGPVPITTKLESVKVLRPGPSDPELAPRAAIEEAVRIAESGDAVPRVYCLSATVPGEWDNGRQSGTSAAIDHLAWNKGQKTRLFCVAGGNVYTTPLKPYKVKDYEARNRDHRIQSPSQALNAISVGACTHKDLERIATVAPVGDLCPTSRTSLGWLPARRNAIKPDVVFEGGNHVFDPEKTTSRGISQTAILTTGKEPGKPLDYTADTSAATAAVAGLATRIMAAYPTLRAETVRGLIINSARWTPAMLKHAEAGESKKILLDCFGWGVPDEAQALKSSGNSVSLVIEDTIQPFQRKGNGNVGLKELKYFALPWPRKILSGVLGRETIELRCTLSYFVEPDPLAEARSRKDRYASHRLRWRLNQPGDTPQQAQSRVNSLVEPDDGVFLTDTASDRNWEFDQRSISTGTVHTNVWRGPGHELAERGGICIYPVKGWWANHKEAEYQRVIPFSLTVTIATARTDVDLYAEVKAAAVKLGITPLAVAGARR